MVRDVFAMKSKIISLNVGLPQTLEWEGRKVSTSMLKHPVSFLQVHPLSIDGDKFANPQAHGTPDSVLYIFGMKSLLTYMRTIGRSTYSPGALGENVTCEELDETQVSVGDIFRIGEVVAQATFPRIPCAKVNVRMQHPEGQKRLEECGRSGVYFRILEPGKIQPQDFVERIEPAKIPFMISDVYANALKRIAPWADARERALANGAFPKRILEKWNTLS